MNIDALVATAGALTAEALAPRPLAAAGVALAAVLAVVGLVRHVRRLRRDLRQQRDRHRRALRRDPLTGVATRAALRDRLDALDGTVGFAVVVVDLDAFALVNERHGEVAGDAVLAEVARRVARHAGPDDVVGRLDGDAFALVRPGRVREDELGAFVDALLTAVRAPVVLPSGGRLTVAASAGRATAAAGMRPLAVVRAAEQNLLVARRSRTAVDRAVEARLGPGGGTLDVTRLVPAQRTLPTAETALVVRH